MDSGRPSPPRRPAAAALDLRRGWSLSFAACGFLGVYYIGVLSCLNERAPHFLRGVRTLFGASAGALCCVLAVSEVPLEVALRTVVRMVRRARSRNAGVFHPTFDMTGHLRDSLNEHLPANVHQLVSGKVAISLTRASDGKNVLVSDFRSKDEVVDALLCSTFIPFICGFVPPSFRGTRYVDGALSDSLPFLDTRTTITVAPFFGEYDICPKAKIVNFLRTDVAKLNMTLCPENLYFLCRAFFPPDIKVLGEICLRGYIDTARFLEEKGISNRPHPCRSLSLEESERYPGEALSLEASPGTAAWKTRPDQDEPLDHPHLDFLPGDQSTPETLSPMLMAVLSEGVKSHGGYWSKTFNSLPVKVLCYLMVPWTLPVEAAVITAWRLVTRLPAALNNIGRLQALTAQLGSRAVKQLWLTSR